MSPDEKIGVGKKEATTEGGTSGVSLLMQTKQYLLHLLQQSYRNKFALGSLSYDSNGIQVSTEDSGVQDFMQTFMSKDKPFNYSLWMKTIQQNKLLLMTIHLYYLTWWKR